MSQSNAQSQAHVVQLRQPDVGANSEAIATLVCRACISSELSLLPLRVWPCVLAHSGTWSVYLRKQFKSSLEQANGFNPHVPEICKTCSACWFRWGVSHLMNRIPSPHTAQSARACCRKRRCRAPLHSIYWRMPLE